MRVASQFINVFTPDFNPLYFSTFQTVHIKPYVKLIADIQAQCIIIKCNYVIRYGISFAIEPLHLYLNKSLGLIESFRFYFLFLESSGAILETSFVTISPSK